MMNLKQLIEIYDHQITGGSEHGWNCFPDARYLDFESEHADANVLYSTRTQEVYEATISSKGYDNQHVYRWINPVYQYVYDAEAEARNIDNNIAWDDVRWTTLEIEDDFLDKAESVFNGVWFDTRIQVPVKLSDDDFIALAKMAHDRDITFNEMVEEILRIIIAEHAAAKNDCGGESS